MQRLLAICPGYHSLESKMKSKFWLFGLALLGASGMACAEDGMISTSISNIVNSTEKLSWAVVSGFESRHVGGNEELNDHNRGIGIRAEGGWVLGGYYNSYRRYSVYAGREFQWRMVGEGENGVNFGVTVGAVSGYLDGLRAGQKHGINLMLVPEVVAVTKYAEIALMYIPEMTKTPATFAAQLRFRWP